MTTIRDEINRQGIVSLSVDRIIPEMCNFIIQSSL